MTALRSGNRVFFSDGASLVGTASRHGRRRWWVYHVQASTYIGTTTSLTGARDLIKEFKV